MYPIHNDYEIVDRIKEGDEEAFTLLADQYERFIKKKIHRFNLAYDKEELVQEGLILLHKSALIFDESRGKTFTRFFEMNLERLFISRIKRLKRRSEIGRLYEKDIASMNHRVRESSVYYPLFLEEVREVLSPFEFAVYNRCEMQCEDHTSVAASQRCDTKSVYNALHRAKAKIRAYFGD